MEGLPGVFVGHWTDRQAATGCTVLLCPQGCRAAVEVRGSAPGTRETDALRPGNLVERVHGILLTGGSAFGLDAATGVMRWCAARGIGFETPAGKVPIVAAAVLYDLDRPEAQHRRTPGPSAEQGWLACEAADVDQGTVHAVRGGPGLLEIDLPQGRVGAGTGATVGKLMGPAWRMDGGLGAAAADLPTGHRMATLAAVNSLGDVVDPWSGEWVAGAFDPASGRRAAAGWPLGATPPGPGQATTLAVIWTNLPLQPIDLHKVAAMAHDGLARAVRPAHTLFDGDTIFAMSAADVAMHDALPSPALPPRPALVSMAGAMAAELVARAVVTACARERRR